MTRAAVLLLLGLLLLPATAGAAPRTLVFPTLYGEYQLAFDDARISEADVRALVVLSPHLAGWESLAVAPRLERCVPGDPAYLDCTRASDSPRFLWNARANLDAGLATLRQLSDLRTPAELDPVVGWLRRSLAFSLWLEETKLDFYRSRDAGVLRRGYEGAEPGRACAPALAAVGRASSRQAQDDVVALEWHNCVNELVRRGLGEYPFAAWQRFLATWGVSERLIETLPTRADRVR
jgi:hypothetical protein